MNNDFTFLEATTISFASSSQSSQLLGTSDVFTSSLSAIDVAARLGNAALNSEQDYLDYATKQAVEWTTKEIADTRATIKSVENKIKALGLKLNLPKQIILVKSTMAEEGNAGGYTRSNYIALGSNPSEDLFVHELFHVFSRHNPAKRDQLYETLQFKKCNRITFPSSLKDLKVTNPDAPFIEHFVKAQINGTEKEIVFITRASKPYEGGSFFEYLQKRAMEVEGDTNNKQAKLIDGKPILIAYAAIENLEALIGNNTGYNIHPEEILADHFKLLVKGEKVSAPSFLDAMKKLLN